MCAVMTAEQAQTLSPLSLPQTIHSSMAEFLQVSQSKEEPAKEGICFITAPDVSVAIVVSV